MNFWNQVSLLRLLFPFLLGILAAIHFTIFFAPYFSILVSGILIFCILSENRNPRFSYRFRWTMGILVAFLLFICGVQLTALNTAISSSKHYSNYLGPKNYALAQISEAPIKKRKSFKTEIKIKALFQLGKWNSCTGKAMLSMEQDTASAQLHYGDLILLHTTFNLVPAPQNPSEFNYQQYLKFHNINYQAYVKRNAWKFLHQNNGNFILKKCLALRDYLLKVFQENGIGGAEYAVGAALILGYEDKLDAAIMNAYSASGALHVLSVSGLHIAIVLVVLSYLLKFLEKVKNGKLLKASVLILLLWFYAALTGLSPSVLRSAAMFTLLIIGKSLNRSTNIYNTLAASMFFLLLWDPYLIMEVGFQLSYLAVVGIVALQPGIALLWEPKNKLLAQVWAITSVSLAAQLATFPLGLFYFHQFPNYFLISNLIVIPVSTLVLYLGVAVCMLAKIKVVSGLLCKLLGGSLWFLNTSVQFFEKLPHAVIQGVSITLLETWLIYALLFSFLLFFMFQKIPFLKSGLALTVLLLIALLVEKYQQLKQEKFVVYNVKNASAIDFVQGNRNYFFADTALLYNKGLLLFQVKTNWWDMGMDASYTFDKRYLCAGFEAPTLRSKNYFIQFNSKKIVCVNPQSLAFLQNAFIKEPIDFVIVSENANIRMEKLKEKVNFKKIIFDSSNSKSSIKYWKKQCEENGIAFYDVILQGAFVEAF